MRKRAREIVDDLGMDIDVNAQVSSLTVAKKQIVEIMHAINNNSMILIMDEPSAVLTNRELEVMFRIVRAVARARHHHHLHLPPPQRGVRPVRQRQRCCANGKQHRHQAHWRARPAEPDQHDGRPRNGSGIPQGAGHDRRYHPQKWRVSPAASCAISASRSKAARVFGISGLVGAGRHGAGAGHPRHRQARIRRDLCARQKGCNYHTFADAIRDGLGLIPEDRKLQGLVQIMSVERNTTLVNLKRVSQNGVLRKGLEKKLSGRIRAKAARGDAPAWTRRCNSSPAATSRRWVIAKWLFQDADILFLDEPTRGIDVGAKAEIYRLIDQMVKDGQDHHHDLLGDAGTAGHVRPHHGHARGPQDGRTGRRGSDAGKDHGHVRLRNRRI